MLSLGAAEDDVSEDSVEEDSVMDADMLEDPVVVDVIVDLLAVELVAVESDAVDVMLPVDDATEELSVAVLCAPTTPKLGEKLMLEGLASSMISMVYWKELTWLGSTVKVKVPSAAGIAARNEVSACRLDGLMILTGQSDAAVRGNVAARLLELDGDRA